MTRWRENVIISRLGKGDIKEIYSRLIAEKLEKIVFYDVEDFSLDYFRYFVDLCDGWFYVCRNDQGKLLGFFFMSDFESARVCRIHFCTFRAGRPYLIAGGHKVLDWLVPCYFDSLIGWLPELNKPAVKYLERLGFHIIGRVPGACGCAHFRDCAAVMSVYTQNEA